MTALKLGSLFDGSGGFSLAGAMCGITPIWASEIEPYPIAVTRARFPDMLHLGDISKINGGDIPPVDIITFGSPCQDLSIAGNRAGLVGERSGLFMEAIRIIKEMREATDGEYPRYILWENVFGAFSSKKGEDFRSVLQEITAVADDTVSIPRPKKWTRPGSIVGDGYSIAWRTFDAQYWGVPQRRRRIFLVADFGGNRASEILFKQDGVCWHPAQSRAAWQAPTLSAVGDATGANEVGGVAAGFNGWRSVSGSLEYGEERAPCLQATMPPNVVYSLDRACFNQGQNALYDISIQENLSQTLVARGPHAVAIENHPGDSRIKIKEDGVAQSLSARMGTGGGNGPLVMYGYPCEHKTLKIRSGCEGGGKGALAQKNLSATLSCNNDQTVFVPEVFDAWGNGDGNTAPTIVGDHQNRITDYTAICLQGNGIDRSDTAGCNGCGYREGAAYTLNTVDRHAVAKQEAIGIDAYNGATTGAIASSIGCKCGDPTGRTGVMERRYRWIVRRLTPTECARLQGFPDWWSVLPTIEDMTDEDVLFWNLVLYDHAKINGKAFKSKTKAQLIKWYNKLGSDSAVYKMWGNGIALPPAVAILRNVSGI